MPRRANNQPKAYTEDKETRKSWAENWTVDKQKYTTKEQALVYTVAMTTFDPPVTPLEALVPAHLDFEVQILSPEFPAEPVPGVGVPGYIVRGPIKGSHNVPIVLPDPVPPGFNLRQTKEVAEELEDFFPVIAAGPMDQKFPAMKDRVEGARMMMVFAAGETRLFTGVIKHLVLLKEPTCLTDETLLLQYCPLWVTETAMMSMPNVSGDLVSGLTIKRSAQWRRELRDAANYFRITGRNGWQEFMAVFTKMARRKITEVEMYQTLDFVYNKLSIPQQISAKLARGIPLSPSERAYYDKVALQNRYQADHYPEVAVKHYQTVSKNHPDIAGSALALYIAICEFEDRRATRFPTHLAQEALFSVDTRSRHRNKQRAFAALTEQL